jgi:hypothetical protein
MPASTSWSVSTPLSWPRRLRTRVANGRIAHQIGGELLLGALLGEVEAGPVVEAHPQRDRTLARLGRGRGDRVAVVQPAGPGQVDDQVQVAGDDVEELPEPPGSGDLLTVQRGRRRVEGLQRADRGDVDPLDATTDHPLAQVRRERLDLRQFGHATTVPSTLRRRLVR